MPVKRKRKVRKAEELQQIAEDVRILLILLLLKVGAQRKEIAQALEVDQATVSRMLAGMKIQDIEFK